MNTLSVALKKYLALRRKLGSQLRGVDSGLQDFVAFAKREGASYITTDLALRWAQEPAQAQPVTWASRLRMVRCFAVWLSATDRRTEVPPVGILPYRYRRRPPYIYTDAEIAALIRAATRLASPQGLRGRTYSTIFGLLSVTGMRVSEALALDREDVDLEQGILRIRRTKFGKSRLVLLHESTCQVLAAYALARDRHACERMRHSVHLCQGVTRGGPSLPGTWPPSWPRSPAARSAASICSMHARDLVSPRGGRREGTSQTRGLLGSCPRQ